MSASSRLTLPRRLAAIATLAIALAAQAESPTGFRDLKWGDPSERLGELNPPRPASVAELRCHTKKDENFTFGEATLATIHYCFFRNRFYSFELQAPPGKAHFDALKRELVKRYGTPIDDGPLSARWGDSKDQVQLTLLSGSGELGALLDAYYSPIGIEVLRAEAAAAAARPANAAGQGGTAPAPANGTAASPSSAPSPTPAAATAPTSSAPAAGGQR